MSDFTNEIPGWPFKLAWGSAVTGQFAHALLQLCGELGWVNDQASDLMACMAFETGGTFSPSVVNRAGSGATGLIQFMPLTARGLGTTTGHLSLMTAVEQLDYVKAYFKPYAHRINNLSDMYMAILMPKYISAPQTAILFDSGIAYRQNAGLDKDKDGKVTKHEAAAHPRAWLDRGMKSGNYSLMTGI